MSGPEAANPTPHGPRRGPCCSVPRDSVYFFTSFFLFSLHPSLPPLVCLPTAVSLLHLIQCFDACRPRAQALEWDWSQSQPLLLL